MALADLPATLDLGPEPVAGRLHGDEEVGAGRLLDVALEREEERPNAP